MKLTDWSDKASNGHSWSSTLYAILRPVPRPLSVKFGNSCSRYRHSPGDIWRHTLAVSVYHDLAGNALKHHSPESVIWRRFVRVEHLGLSGVIFYEIPISPESSSGGAGDTTSMPQRKTDSSNTARGALALRIRQTHPAVAPPRITLVSVFGDLNSDADAGMDLEDLMDEIDAKVVYFPAYACTSFIIGQVMTAFLNDCPSRKPVPAHDGFSICLAEHVNDPPAPNESVENKAMPTPQTTPTPSSIRKVDDLLCLSAHSIPDTLMLEADNPYVSLCIRASAAYRPHSRIGVLGLSSALKNSEEEMADSPGQVAENEYETLPTLPFSEEPDSESNIATDGQSSPVPQSASSSHISVNALTNSSLSSLDANNGRLQTLGPLASTADPGIGFLPDKRQILSPESRDKAMHSLHSLDSSAASAARRAVSQKYKRLRANHSLSARFPCLARAKRLPQLLYVYRDFLSSESFMDFSGAS